ncbi:hypothetical protein ISCGN_021100 [Ixodes scapularis]
MLRRRSTAEPSEQTKDGRVPRPSVRSPEPSTRMSVASEGEQITRHTDDQFALSTFTPRPPLPPSTLQTVARFLLPQGEEDLLPRRILAAAMSLLVQARPGNLHFTELPKLQRDCRERRYTRCACCRLQL